MRRNFYLTILVLSCSLFCLPQAVIALEAGRTNVVVPIDGGSGHRDNTPPTGSITIDNDAQYTNTTDVTLNLSAEDNPGGSGLGEMSFSNDGLNWSPYETYATTREWTLTTADATKTVYVKFRDNAGNLSTTYQDTIILDTVSPTIIITSPEASSIYIYPDISLEGTIDGVPFTEPRTLEYIGTNTLTEEAQDEAGNESSASVDVIYSPGEVIGPEGGEVISPDGGARFLIPAGAVTEPTRISVTRRDATLFEDNLPDNYISTVGVHCAPMGLLLQEEAQLIVTLDTQEIPGTEIDLALYNYETEQVELLGQASTVSEDGLTVTFSFQQLSEYLGLRNTAPQGVPIGAGVEVPLPDLLTGSYSYDVPIVVPPGRQKMQPNLFLHYNSSNTNSWIGFGWNLNPGYIIRSTKYGIPSYNDTEDTFILVNQNGAIELVYLIDNLYQAKIESEFNRFYKETTDSWRVVQKDGTILEFGATTDSKEGSASGTFSWQLTKVRDTNGNYIELSYTKDEGKSYLSSIRYTGNENASFEPTHTINFYTEDRDDVISSYISGSKIMMQKRLSAIEVLIQAELVWRYELTYEYAQETNRSLLKSLSRYTSGGSPFPEQTYYYQTHDGGVE